MGIGAALALLATILGTGASITKNVQQQGEKRRQERYKQDLIERNKQARQRALMLESVGAKNPGVAWMPESLPERDYGPINTVEQLAGLGQQYGSQIDSGAYGSTKPSFEYNPEELRRQAIKRASERGY